MSAASFHGSIAERAVVGLREDAVPAASVPQVLGRRGPRDVAHVLRRELPGEHAGRRAAARRRTRSSSSVTMLHRRGRLRRLREPRDLRGREHLARVGERAGARHDVAGGDGDAPSCSRRTRDRTRPGRGTARCSSRAGRRTRSRADTTARARTARRRAPCGRRRARGRGSARRRRTSPSCPARAARRGRPSSSCRCRAASRSPVGRLRRASTCSNRSTTSPPSKPRAPKRDSCGKMNELSDLSLKAFCSICIQMKRSVSGELLV